MMFHSFRLNLRRSAFSLLAGLLCLNSMADEKTTRGIGVYPGNPDECFAPTLITDSTYRNLALNRRAWHSSSYDYNLTAQLITDGYAMTKLGYWLVTTSDGNLPKREREWSIDGNDFSRNILMGEHAWIHYEWNHTTLFDSIEVVAQVVFDDQKANSGYRIQMTSDDDSLLLAEWLGQGCPGVPLHYRMHADPNKQTSATLLPVRILHLGQHLSQEVAGTLDDLKLNLHMEGAAYWNITEVKVFYRNQRVELLSSGSFSSAWMSDGGGQQWVMVDLGSRAEIHELKAFWLMAPSSWQIEISDDGIHWSVVRQLIEEKQLTHTGKRDCLCLEATTVVPLETPVYGRYVRILTTGDNCLGRYALSELQVMGRGGIRAVEHPVEGWRSDGSYSLNGGHWRLRHEHANYGGLMQGISQLNSPEGQSFGGIVATVPGTVLTSYLNIEAIPNPNFDDDLMMISESFFRQPFIYRTVFEIPDELLAHRCVMLNLDGINWKAEVWLNGQYVGRVDGAFLRGRFDVSRYLKPGSNVLALRIRNNTHFGGVKEKNEQNTDFNGGILGADNPTFHASIGWDWISTVRGRNMGIWGDVYLTAIDGIELSDPLVVSKVDSVGSDVSLATVTPSVVVINRTDTLQQTVLKGWIGDIHFEQPLTLDAYEEHEVIFSPDDFPQLKKQPFHLWWPNGYGTPYLYKAGFSLLSGGDLQSPTSTLLEYQAGIREVTYEDELTSLKIYVNERRFIPLGGNWGFSEHNLNYRSREYDAAVDYHRQMNFTMIRNWVGQTGHQAFYEACDRYGIMVWQDFWLANPSDGPNPEDEAMFMANAEDYVKRIRRHPCIALYCGRNEGYPPPSLNEELQSLVSRQHRDMAYIPSSADDGVGGHGPYHALPQQEYFKRTVAKLHTERGMPNVMNFESLSRTLRPSHLWPQNAVWGQHDYTLKGAQRGESFNQLIARTFGEPESAKQFTEWAQWINYDGYRAMFESNHVSRAGLIIWMSHPAFPSMVWQTYDYFLDPTAAFFACKKACEPLHVQWNALSDSIEVVNTRAGNHKKVRACMQVFDVTGTLLKQKTKTLRSPEDTTLRCMKVKKPKKFSDVWFLRLSLQEGKGAVVSENTYVRSSEGSNWHALRTLPQAQVETSIRWDQEHASISLRNSSSVPALMLRLQLLGSDGEQILPVSFSDNYFHLMPGEKRTIEVSWKAEDTRGLQPHLIVAGMNVKDSLGSALGLH